MKHANPYLNFDGNAREAFEHYRDVFGGDFVTAMTFREFGGEQMGIDGTMLDRLAHIALPLGTSLLMGSDVTRPQDFKVGTNHYIALEASPAPRNTALITNSSMITALLPSAHCM